MSRRARLFGLVSLLSGRRHISLREIADRFDISERTAYRDLAALDEIPVPVIHDRGGYRLLEGATVRTLNLTGEERALLRLALANPILGAQLDVQRRLRSLEAKIDAITRDVEETPSGLRLAGIDRTGPLPDGLLSTLDAAVARRRGLELCYASLSGRNETWRRVDPYAVVHRSEAWYLVGHCHENGEPRTFRVDRIRATRETGAGFEIPLGFDLAAYFADSWGILRGRRRQRVVLRFAARLAPLVMSATHHPGEEKEVLADGRVEYRVVLTHLGELRQWIAGFGGDVEVVAPRGLRPR